MTQDETEDFLAEMDGMVRSGDLPDIEALSQEQKNILLWACRLIDTSEKRKAAAFVLSQLKDKKDYRGFAMFMALARAGVTIKDFVLIMWSIPGAILVVAAYLALGGDKQIVLDFITGLIK